MHSTDSTQSTAVHLTSDHSQHGVKTNSYFNQELEIYVHYFENCRKILSANYRLVEGELNLQFS